MRSTISPGAARKRGNAEKKAVIMHPDPLVIRPRSLQEEAGRQLRVRQTYEAAIREMEPFVQIHEAERPLRLDTAAQQRLTDVKPVVFHTLAASLEQANEYLLSGQLTLPDVAVQTEAGVPTAKTFFADGCAGVTATSTYWWGVQSCMNQCQTDDFIGLVEANAGIAAICAFLSAGGAFPCDLVGGILVLTAGYLHMISSSGRGICVNSPWFGPPWATSQ